MPGRALALSGLLLAAVALGLPADRAKADEIVVATEGAYPPFNYKDAAGNLVGFEIDFTRELCRRISANCRIIEQDWDGIIPALMAGKYDAIIAAMSITEERRKTIAFSRPYADTPMGFATLSGNGFARFRSPLDRLDLDDPGPEGQGVIRALAGALGDMTTGVQGATIHETFMRTYMPDVRLVTYDTIDNVLLDLEAGRVDAVYSELLVFGEARGKMPDLVNVGPAMTGGLLGEGVGIGLRQEDTELRARFDRAIGAMIADGYLGELSVRWFGFDSSPM